MSFRKPSYYYKDQKLLVIGDDRFSHLEEVRVVIAAHAQAKSIKCKDIAGMEYDIPAEKLFVDMYVPSTTYSQPAKPKQYAKDYAEFTPGQKYLIELLALTTHQSVVQKTLAGIDLAQYDVFEGPMWYMAVPKNLQGKVPVLMAHTDTVVKNPNEATLEYDPVTKKFYSAHGLGADDRAGCWAINSIMKVHPNKFAFCLFDKEETGCLGSKQFVESIQFQALDKIATCYISIDRKREYDGGGSIATYGYDSKELNDLVAKVTGRKIVDGSVTDCKQLSAKSYELGGKLPCFNFSCGYQNEHTHSEVLYWDELVRVVNDASKLVDEAPEMWAKKWEATKKAWGGTTYYGGAYNNPKSKTKKDTFDFDEDCMILDGAIYDPQDLRTLLWLYAQEHGEDYDFKSSQKFIKEYKKQTVVRLDPMCVAGGTYGGVLLDAATYNKLVSSDWVVKSFDDNLMTLELTELGRDKYTASNIPYAWMSDVTTTDALVRK